MNVDDLQNLTELLAMFLCMATALYARRQAVKAAESRREAVRARTELEKLLRFAGTLPDETPQQKGQPW